MLSKESQTGSESHFLALAWSLGRSKVIAYDGLPANGGELFLIVPGCVTEQINLLIFAISNLLVCKRVQCLCSYLVYYFNKRLSSPREV